MKENLKWVLITGNDNNQDMEVFESKEEALAEADYYWNRHLTKYERKKNHCIVALANVDEESNNFYEYFDENDNLQIDSDLREIALEY